MTTIVNGNRCWCLLVFSISTMTSYPFTLDNLLKPAISLSIAWRGGGKIIKPSPQVKRQLWGGEFWSDGYFASTVGKHGDESMIANYVKKQGNEYLKLHRDEQLALF